MLKVRDWNDVIDILYFGTKEDILSLACPDCGGPIQYQASASCSTFQVSCVACGVLSRGHGIPDDLACVKYFGESYTIPARKLAGVG